MSKSKDKPNINGAAPTKPKEKRRSNEKRKEKSRDAARCRRSRETEIFTELGQVLPLQREEVEQLDKASIMRLSIAFLKARDVLNMFPNIDNIQELPALLSGEDDRIDELEKKPFDLLNGPESYKYLSSALDGFLLILSADGDVTYVSESISEYLGISQIDLLGQQIWEYTHQCDHDELKEALNVRRSNLAGDEKPKEIITNGGSATTIDNNNSCGNDNNSTLTTAHRDFFLRLKCTLTSRGRSVNIKSASYKVIHMTGHMVMNTSVDRILIGVGRPLPHPSNIEIPLGSSTFLTKHSLDMKFTYVDDKMLSLLGYEPEDLLSKSLYECHHGADSESLMTTFKSVISKGQGETCRYRFLGKCGGYCWVVTQATIVYDKQKPQSVVCVNYAISELENNNEIYSCAQLEANRQNKEIPTNDEEAENLQQQSQQNHQQQSQYYSPQKLQNVVSIKNNTCADDNCLSTVKTLLKQQKPVTVTKIVDDNQPSPIVVKRVDTVGDFNSNPLALTQSNCNNNPNIAIRKSSEEISLSPVRRTFNNCSISSKNVKTPPIISTTVEKRPKSVTASVFTQVPINAELLSNLNNQPAQQSNSGASASIAGQQPSQQNQQLSSASSVAPAKSVTASVLTPISALTSSIKRSFLPNYFCKNSSKSSANSANNNSSGSSNNNTNNPNNTAQDMNSRYLLFSEESPELTMLKEEPDDLTHLAPSLDDSTQLFGEMLDSLILPDAYGTLLSDDINSLDSQQSNSNHNNNNNNNNNNNSKNNNHHIDPFINYRDESSDTSSSPHLLSPGSVSKSPEMSSIPSLCSPNSLSQDDEFAFMTMNVEDDIDLTMRAPYIPMNEQEDLPLLTEDLMWSAFSEELSLHKEALQMETLKNNHNNNSVLNSNSSNNNCSSNSLPTMQTTSISNNTSNNNSNHHSSSSNNKNNISTAQDNNSNNINDNESSLAALLCGNGGVNVLHQHHHHQQQQSHHSQENGNERRNSNTMLEDSPSGVDCKRRKILSDRNDNFTNDLMDSIDDFGPVFSKNSANVDCWALNHLLQINDSTPPSPTTASLHQCHLDSHPMEKQNIITTIHVPLITIQNKNSNLKMNCNTIMNPNVNTITNNTTGNNSNDNSNGSNTMRRLSATLVKGINLNLPTSTNTNSNMMQGKSIGHTLNIGTIVNIPNNNTSKRPSNNMLTSSESKRSKNSLIIETPTSPQLLQQLMAPSPQKSISRSPYDKLTNGNLSRWSGDVDGSNNVGNTNSTGRNNNGHQSSTSTTSQSSNSVLKNLLVSGCDETFIHQPPDNLLEEAQLSRSLQNSPQPDFFTNPLICKISADQVLHRRGTNPLIGGEGILPSPPIPIDVADSDEGGGGNAMHMNIGAIKSYVGSAFSPVGSDSGGSDSGIEYGVNMNRGSPAQMSRILPDAGDKRRLDGSPKTEPPASSPNVKMTSAIPVCAIGNDAASLNNNGGPRKMSFSFLDEDNPLCSPFLMDFGDEVYSIDEPMGSEFLQAVELTKVLNDWAPTDASA